MGSTLRVGAAIASLLVLAGATGAASSLGDDGSSGSDDRKSVVLHFMGRLVDDPTTPTDPHYTDVAPPGYSQGDQFVYTFDLRSKGNVVGRESGSCTATIVESDEVSTLFCLGTHSVPGGQITTGGVISYGPADTDFKRDPYSLAITGGTGKYRTAHGEARVQELSPTEYLLTLRIVL